MNFHSHRLRKIFCAVTALGRTINPIGFNCLENLDFAVTHADQTQKIAIFGAGLTGVICALECADNGADVTVFEASDRILGGASRIAEGKIHLGYVYGADPGGKTRARMIDGALVFQEIVERWVSKKEFSVSVSDGFDYIVPHDSQLSIDEIKAHFDAISDLINQKAPAKSSYLGHDPKQPWRRTDGALYNLGPKAITAAFETVERSVDMFLICDALEKAVYQHPRITVIRNSRVLRAFQTAKGWAVELQGDAARQSLPVFSHVVNAAWEGRHQIDQRSGHAVLGDWFTRYKCAVNFDYFGDLAHLRNFTGMLGPYGDVVKFQSGRLFASWYPTGMIASTTNAPLAVPTVSDELARKITQDVLDHLGAWHPPFRTAWELGQISNPVVTGGMIMARGTSDIHDPASQLHERHQIGLEELARGYYSIDTGKLTTAPMLGMACAAEIQPRSRIFSVA